MGNEHSGGWPAVAIELTPDERTKLEGVSRQRTAPYREVLRARALLQAASGARNRSIAHAVGVDERTVRTWRKDFVQRRLESLHDRKRSGRPRRFSPSVRAALTHLCCQKPGTEVSVPTDLLPVERQASTALRPDPNPLAALETESTHAPAASGAALEGETEQAGPVTEIVPSGPVVQGSEAEGGTVLFPPDIP
jgi:transposase